MKGIIFGIVGFLVFIVAFLVIKEEPAQTNTAVPKPQEIIEIPRNPYITDFVDSLDQHIEQLHLETNVPGIAIAVVYQGRTVFKKAYGVKVNGTTQPIDTNTVFRLASVSKGFTSILTGLLAHDDVLSWDDKVTYYLPKFQLKARENTDSLTLRHLLSHTSGLQYQAYTTLVEDGWERDSMIQELKNADIISSAGQLYSYQNLAYSIVEPIIEQVTQKPFPDVMTERIFQPLNMENASLTYDDFKNNLNIARPHLFRGNRRFKKIRISPTYYNVASAGGINASISDIAKWMKAIMGHNPEIVSPKVTEQVFHPYVKTMTMERSFRRIERDLNFYYGLGWRMVQLPADTIIYHGGYANGYRSGIALDPKDDIAVGILTNSSLDLPGEIMADFFDLYYQRADSIKNWRYKNVF